MECLTFNIEPRILLTQYKNSHSHTATEAALAEIDKFSLVSLHNKLLKGDTWTELSHLAAHRGFLRDIMGLVNVSLKEQFPWYSLALSLDFQLMNGTNVHVSS